MKVIYTHEHPPARPNLSLFLAGPSPRGADDANWRPRGLEILADLDFTGTVYIPLPRDGEYRPDYDRDAQSDWELQYLEDCDAIAFWVPRHRQNLPGFTTNVEFGLFARSGRMVFGHPPEAHKVRYLRHVARRFGIPTWSTLEETLAGAVKRARERADP